MPSASRPIFLGFLLGAAVVARAPAQQSVVSPVGTVSDAVFRSEWVGPQADRPALVGMVPTGEGIKPVEDVATKVREGLWLGSLRIRPGFGAGWAYSNRNSQGQNTDANSDQSFFLSPSLGLEYGRDTGPWSISARAGGGYVYYLNPDYTQNGTGANRNPYNGTMSLGIGHSGLRHAFDLGGSASFGNGQSIQGGGASTQFVGAAGANYSYLINEFLTTGAYASYNTQLNRYESGDIDGSDLVSLRGGGYIDWLWTGKTTLGLKVEAGRMSQDILGNDAAVGQEGIAARQFLQALVPVAHNLTSKVLLVAGAGVSYTQDENIPNADAQYTGVRPVYLFGVQYDPSEKTTMRAYTSFDGFDIVPSYGFSLTWRPRVTTAFTFSAYQNQNFSITTVDQFQVNRGFTAGVQQTVFSRFAIGVSGGWQQTDNVSLSDNRPSGGDFDYAFVSGSLRYSMNSWASWQATVMSSTGNRVNATSTLDFPETTASIGLNLLF